MHKPSEHFQEISQLTPRLTEIVGGRDCYIITDDNVEEHCLPQLIQGCEPLQEADIITVHPGEVSKCMEILEGVLLTLLENNANRQSLIVNVGGGVISDLGGFGATIYKRGVEYINVPTSLLAMTDAAIGGKTAVNLGSSKNMVGSFHQPLSVLCCFDFLKTLPEEELKSGMAEMLKHGLIADKDLWSRLNSFDLPTIQGLIERSARIKEKIVQSDPLEKGPRKLLNFGHSIGHAIESLYLDKEKVISHGHAIAIGLILESYLSVKHTGLSSASFDGIHKKLASLYEIPKLTTKDIDKAIDFLRNDKKNRDGEFIFTLIKEIGAGIIEISITESQIVESFDLLNG